MINRVNYGGTDMKELAKRSAAFILCLLLTAGLCACGGNTEKKSEEFRTPKIFEDITEKTGIHMEVEMEEEGTEMELYRKKDNLYVDYEDDETNVIVITDGETITVLDPASKTGVQSEVDDDAQEQLDSMAESFESIYKAGDSDTGWKKGTVKYDGMEYESEEAGDEDDKTQFLYNDDGELVYVISEKDGETSAIKIKALDNDIPKDIFEVPDGYTISGGGDTEPEPAPAPKTDDSKKDNKSTTRIPTPSGKEVTFTNEDHGYQFKVDSAYATKIDDYSMKVFTYKDGQVPYFSLSLMQNRSGQSDEQLLEGVGKQIIEREGDNLVKGPIANTVQAGSRKIKGIEWIYKSEDGTKEYVGVQYTELIGNFFYTWTGVYENGDTVTPAAIEHAMATFEMLAT